MSGTHLTDLDLGLTLERFLEAVWENGDYLKDFLTDKLLEKDVVITDWISISPADVTLFKYERTITSLHPLPLSLPWLPVFVKSSNTQTLEYDILQRQLTIVEVSTIKGLPFVDPYIITTWNVLESPSGSCHATINLRFQYDQTSWLQSMVESNSTTELIKFFEMWVIYFAEKVQSMKDSSELEKSPGLHFLCRLLPEIHERSEKSEKSHVSKECSKNCEEITSVSRSNESSSDSTIISNGSIIHEKVEILSSESTSTIINVVLQNTEIVTTILESVHVNGVIKHVAVTMKESEKGELFEIKDDSSSINASKINVLKIFLSGLQSNGIIKLIVAIFINLYAKINVAAFHGIEVTDIIRSILDQTASLSLIYCFLLIVEITITMSSAIISTLSKRENTHFVDDIDDVYNPIQLSSKGGFKPIISVIKSAAITLFQSKPSVVCVSIGTQTDASLISNGIQINTVTAIDDDRDKIPMSLSSVEEPERAVLDSSKMSVKDTVDSTWRDCSSPTLHNVKHVAVTKI